MAWNFNAVIILAFNANELTFIQQIHSICILVGKNTEHHSRSSKISGSFIEIAKWITRPWGICPSQRKRKHWKPSLTIIGEKRIQEKSSTNGGDIGASTCIWQERWHYGQPIRPICPKIDWWWGYQSIQNLTEHVSLFHWSCEYHSVIKWWNLEDNSFGLIFIEHVLL